MPSAAWITWTTSHSRPLAEWIVDRTSVVLVQERRAGEVAGGRRRVERQLAREPARASRTRSRAAPAAPGRAPGRPVRRSAGRTPARGTRGCDRAATAGGHGRSRRPGSPPAPRGAPARRSTRRLRNRRAAPRRNRTRGATARSSSARRTPSSSISRRAVAGPDPFEQLQHAEPADLVERVLQHRGAARARPSRARPPGTSARRTSRTGCSAGPAPPRAGRCGAPARNSTACCFSGDALARGAASTLRQTASHCSASSRHVRRIGRRAPSRDGPQRLLVALRRQRDHGVRRRRGSAGSSGSSAPAGSRRAPGNLVRELQDVASPSRRGTRRSPARRRRPP